MPAPPESVRAALTEALGRSISGPIPSRTPRQVPGTIELPGKATAIIGVRRAGKTTLLHQLRQQRLSEGMPHHGLPFINFEDERLASLEAAHVGFLLDEHRRRVPNDDASETTLWCFDEIQVVPQWERFVRRLLDTGSADVMVTGSSATLLSREIGTALRGRAWAVPLFPFSFAESLVHAGKSVPKDSARVPAQQRGRLEKAFLDWLDIGGFPEAQGLDAPSRRQLLRDYVDVAMLRDVVERHQVSNVTGLRWLVRHLLGNAGGSFSIEKFHNAIKSQGIAVSRDTLHQMLSYLEDCFLVRTVWMEADSERQRMVNPRKVYPVDSGLIPIFDRTGRANVGHALETAVLIELERRRCEITYVRTAKGFEVDFLARDGEGYLHLIQVCAEANDPATADRELRALTEAARRWPEASLWLLTLTRDGVPEQYPDEVRALPAYEWMLASS